MFFQHIMFTKMAMAIYGGIVAVFFMVVGFRFLAGMLALDISNELQEKNAAVGMAVMGMYIGIGVAIGIVVGLAIH